jgi:hypothetical protein
MGGDKGEGIKKFLIKHPTLALPHQGGGNICGYLITIGGFL